ncbi:hypothetical protein HY045_02780 [Candidatus Woesebacteria bacterium]|nr:hypothetical protein [Candidatus Woesebacteria bacterium]
MKTKSFGKAGYLAPLGALLLLVMLVPSALALGRPGNVGTVPNNVGSRPSGSPGIPQQAQNRLIDAKLKACQARENAIKTRSTHLGQLATTMEEKFDAIAKRVEEYYTTKVVPSGKTVSDYDALVADIQTKKTAVQTALTQAQADSTGFSCTGDDPKGQMTLFRKDMQAVIQALKDYRTSIKSLIVAVHSVTGTTERTSPSPSASPVPTGTP